MTTKIIFSVAALVLAAVAAGCTPAAHPGADTNSTVATSGSQAQPQANSPYNQPLMATGGDLVMRQAALRAVAG